MVWTYADARPIWRAQYYVKKIYREILFSVLMKKKSWKFFGKKSVKSQLKPSSATYTHIYYYYYVLWYCSKKKNIVKMLNRRKSCDEEIWKNIISYVPNLHVELKNNIPFFNLSIINFGLRLYFFFHRSRTINYTGCKSIFRKIFEFKIWKELMLVLKQTIPYL